MSRVDLDYRIDNAAGYMESMRPRIEQALDNELCETHDLAFAIDCITVMDNGASVDCSLHNEDGEVVHTFSKFYRLADVEEFELLSLPYNDPVMISYKKQQ
jgi:hypothetical protein